MKAIMYHYVRPVPRELPHFRYLHVDNFSAQLEHFAEEYGFLEREVFFAALESGEAPPGVVLTFDDGFSDHYDTVLPILRERGLWGIFYVPTLYYQTGKRLDVHRIHLLLGAFGGGVLMEAVRQMLTDEMLVHQHIDAFRKETYRWQDNDAATVQLKRTLNYYISHEWREHILSRLDAHFFAQKEGMTEGFYMTQTQLKEMQEAGMIIGSHSMTHPVMSKLTAEEQRKEIQGSFDFLEHDLGLGPIETYCHPYGGFHSFNDETERLLNACGCRFSFNVEARDVTAADIGNRPQALPRWDCNQFPHGSSHLGPNPSEA